MYRVVAILVISALLFASCAPLTGPIDNVSTSTRASSIEEVSTRTFSVTETKTTINIIATSTPLKIAPTLTSTLEPLVPPPAGIIYKNSEGAWKINNDGNKEFLFALPPEADRAKFCADGSSVLVEVFDHEKTGGSLYSIFNLATGNKIDLFPGKDQSFCYDANWRPGTCDTVFVSIQPWTQVEQYCEGIPSLIDLNSNVTKIGISGSAFGAMSQPSPDGKYLAFSENFNPWIYEVGVRTYPLLIDTDVFPQKGITFVRPTWSADNRRVAWLVSGLINGKEVEGIGIIDVENNYSQFFYADHFWLGEGPGYLVWNPQEDYILLDTPNGQTSVFDLKGNKLLSVDTSGWKSSGWSPDGKWLTYTSINNEIRTAIVTSPDGKDQHQIGFDMYFTVWSPDSQYIIYEDDRSYWIVEIGKWTPIKIILPEEAEIINWINP